MTVTLRVFRDMEKTVYNYGHALEELEMSTQIDIE
jgi:hypothetical protein